MAVERDRSSRNGYRSSLRAPQNASDHPVTAIVDRVVRTGAGAPNEEVP